LRILQWQRNKPRFSRLKSWTRNALLESAKADALARAEEAINELTTLASTMSFPSMRGGRHAFWEPVLRIPARRKAVILAGC
jgi:hypothetical protein